MNKLNFVFWGTPNVASETLEILKENGYLPSLIITPPDAPKGRGLRLQASAVAVFAEKNGIQIQLFLCLINLNAVVILFYFPNLFVLFYMK